MISILNFLYTNLIQKSELGATKENYKEMYKRQIRKGNISFIVRFCPIGLFLSIFYVKLHMKKHNVCRFIRCYIKNNRRKTLLTFIDMIKVKIK